MSQIAYGRKTSGGNYIYKHIFFQEKENKIIQQHKSKWDEICDGSKAKICAKYAQNVANMRKKCAQNMHNPKL